MMNSLKASFLRMLMPLFISVCALPVSALAADDSKNLTVEIEARETYLDIKKTLGIVPTFFKQFPEEGIAAAWEEMKSMQLNPGSAIPGKYKEMIGLAVAAQVPCKYCVYFHTKAIMLNGGNKQEIGEAVAMASLTRHWSTVLNGMLTNEDAFKKETDKIIAFVKKPPTKTAAPVAVTDAKTAYQDIESTLGSVPTFMKQFPEIGIAAAWKEMKSVQLNPATAIPGKYKELIGLAVAAQIPCRYCVYFHTQAAKLNGATDAELREAVAIAAITRHWSTALNGLQVDEATFRKETDQVMNNVKQQMKAAKKQ
jgi:AhpD family alkylhydroperoxidase